MSILNKLFATRKIADSPNTEENVVNNHNHGYSINLKGNVMGLNVGREDEAKIVIKGSGFEDGIMQDNDGIILGEKIPEIFFAIREAGLEVVGIEVDCRKAEIIGGSLLGSLSVARSRFRLPIDLINPNDAIKDTMRITELRKIMNVEGIETETESED
jgi:hypothetical protein